MTGDYRKRWERADLAMKGLTRIIAIGVLFAVTLIAGAGSAQAAVRLIVLPFEIHGAGDVSTLRREVINTVASRFEREGAEIVGVEEIRRLMVDEGVKGFDEKRAAALGREAGADFAVLGSITRLAGVTSIDWRVFDLIGERNVAFFFKQSDGRTTVLKEIENSVASAYDMALSVMEERPAEKKGVIDEVVVRGNQRVDSEAIVQRVSTGAGAPFSPEGVGEDIKSIYGMGYFEDVKAALVDSAAGKKLTFIVRERPYIKSVDFVGYDKVSKEKIEGAVTVKKYTILNRVLLQEDAEALRALYESEGHFLAEVTYEVTIDESAAGVTFSIKEGPPVRVKRITIIGNDHLSDRAVKKVMGTKERGLFSILTGSGKFNEPLFHFDLESVSDLYFHNGYIQVEIVDHRVLLSEDKRWFYITIALSEGDQYTLGTIDVTGEMVTKKAELMKEITLTSGEVFSRRELRANMERIREVYGDKGYAKVAINPITPLDRDDKRVDITFDIRKGPLVYFEEIDIDGNTKTRDKVIRRELEVEEEQLYSLSGLKRSQNNLRRLGYFEDVAIRESPGSVEDRLSLNVRVKERPTGQISAGFGYSSVDKLFGTASVSQNNLAGTGIKLNISATLGTSTEQYNIGFTEPWLLDMPITAGFDLFKISREFTDFTEKSTGFDVRFGFPLYFKDTRGSLLYKNEEIEINDVADTASLLIKEQQGKSDIRSISGLAKKDSRNDAFFPTAGSVLSLSVEYAGGPLGGDNNFVKYIAKGTKYFPLPRKSALALRGEVGAVHGFDDTPTPISERFFLGGINSIRGFDTRSIGPKDPVTGEVVGGDKEMVFNVELLFPLIAEQRINGIIFFDIGNAYNTRIEFGDMRRSAGAGIRWHSPLGPLRLEWGFNLDRREGEKQGRFEFTMGSAF